MLTAGHSPEALEKRAPAIVRLVGSFARASETAPQPIGAAAHAAMAAPTRAWREPPYDDVRAALGPGAIRRFAGRTVRDREEQEPRRLAPCDGAPDPAATVQS